MEWVLLALVAALVFRHVTPTAAVSRSQSPIGGPTASTPTSNRAPTLPAAPRVPVSAPPSGDVRTVIKMTADGLPSIVRVTNPNTPGIVKQEIFDYIPERKPPAGPIDLISLADAEAQARSAFAAYFGHAATVDDIAALSAAAALPVYNGRVSQQAVSQFLSSPAALAAVSH